MKCIKCNKIVSNSDKFCSYCGVQMKEEDLKAETVQWLQKLNKSFGNELTKEKLLKTGGYDGHSKHQNTKERQDKVDRNKTNRETLNYATQEGTLR